MSVRHAVLAVTAALVVVMGVYLFVEVRAAPAQVTVSAPSDERAPQVVEHPLPSVPAARSMVHSPGRSPEPARSLPGGGLRPLPIHVGNRTLPSSLATPHPHPRLDAVMDEANKAYDRQDFDEAMAIAGKLLVKQPGNVRMLRIMVSASCIEGDDTTAQKYFDQLPSFDRNQMKTRCARYGVTFKDPPQ